VLLLINGPSRADTDQFGSEDFDVNSDVEEWQFQEDVVNLPDFPDFDKLKKVQIDASHGQLQYFIDPKSLKIGRDGVVLATVVITSGSGAKNILFEGYRCDTREYKTFAYGTTKNTFYELADSQWKRVMRTSGTAQDFRRELLAVYFCGADRLYLEPDEIVRLIDYPGFRDDDGRDF
jgi:hypothetical protein